MHNAATNFGDAYNAAMDKAFSDGYEEIIIANDDVVITPTTYLKLEEDVRLLKRNFENVGFVGARSDYVLWHQNIRSYCANDNVVGVKYESEDHIKETGVIATIFAYVSKQAFETARFPSVNWYSDNINSDEQIKIQIRFLSNEVRSDSLEINVHKKKCDISNRCSQILLKNSFPQDIKDSILTKARQIKIEDEKSKKN